MHGSRRDESIHLKQFSTPTKPKIPRTHIQLLWVYTELLMAEINPLVLIIAALRTFLPGNQRALQSQAGLGPSASPAPLEDPCKTLAVARYADGNGVGAVDLTTRRRE